MKSVDYLIVGQGLAGTILSFFIEKSGKSFLVIDEMPDISSSKVAAGIFNPITGRRNVKTWMADELFPFAEKTYEEIESFLGEKIYYKKNIYKPFSSIKEQNDWDAQSSNPEISAYLNNSNDFEFSSFIQNESGGYELTKTGNVDVEKLILDYYNYLNNNNLSIKETFDFTKVILEKDGISYKNIQAGKLIFCEGYKTIHNPYFNYLPFVLAKGEILTIKFSGKPIDKIISKGIFILPIEENKYKVGATYNWKELDEMPSKQAREELIDKLDKLIKAPYEIIDQKAAIRPTVKDRRPLIGLHPKHPQLGIFNGLGTKGVILAPYFGKQFVDFLLGKGELNKEVDIKRFKF